MHVDVVMATTQLISEGEYASLYPGCRVNQNRAYEGSIHTLNKFMHSHRGEIGSMCT